jgi:hypothetical protein
VTEGRLLDYSIVDAFRRRRCPIAPHRRRLIAQAFHVADSLDHRRPTVTVSLFSRDIWDEREPRGMTFSRLDPVAIFVRADLGDHEFLSVLLHEVWHAIAIDLDRDLTRAEREARADGFSMRAVAEWQRRYSPEARCQH